MSTKIILNLFIYCILFDCCIFEMRIITTFGTNPWKTYDYVLAVGHFSSFNLKKDFFLLQRKQANNHKIILFQECPYAQLYGYYVNRQEKHPKEASNFVFLSSVAKFVFSSETFCVSEFCSWTTFSVVR